MTFDELVTKINNSEYKLPDSKWETFSKTTPEGRRQLRQESNELEMLFRKHLSECFDPRCGAHAIQLCVYKAWEDGHASGLTEVVYNAEELSEILDAVLENK